MKTIKIIFSVVFAACLAGLGLWLLPGFWFRQAGVLDLVIVVNCADRTRDDLSSVASLSKRMLRQLYPSDRLGFYVVDDGVHELFCGSFSEPLRVPLVDQINSLSPALQNGADLGPVLAKVNTTLDGFLQDKSPTKSHRRIVVLFSDCADFRGDGRQFSLAGKASVLVVGFRGDRRDAITMALMGNGSNDVHVVGPSEGAVAVDGLLDAVREQTHPLEAAPVLLCFAASALVSGIAVFGLSAVVWPKPRSVRVRLNCANDPETTQDFTLAVDGSSIIVGGGDQLHDYGVPVSASCEITRTGDQLSLCPGSGRLAVRRNGDQFEVTRRCSLEAGDSLILEDVQVVVQRI